MVLLALLPCFFRSSSSGLPFEDFPFESDLPALAALRPAAAPPLSRPPPAVPCPFPSPVVACFAFSEPPSVAPPDRLEEVLIVAIVPVTIPPELPPLTGEPPLYVVTVPDAVVLVVVVVPVAPPTGPALVAPVVTIPLEPVSAAPTEPPQVEPTPLEVDEEAFPPLTPEPEAVWVEMFETTWSTVLWGTLALIVKAAEVNPIV